MKYIQAYIYILFLGLGICIGQILTLRDRVRVLESHARYATNNFRSVIRTFNEQTGINTNNAAVNREIIRMLYEQRR